MDEINDGGSAFPLQTNYGLTLHGMTLRDYFAAQALTGLIHKAWHEIGNSESAYSELAYKLADAMLRARGEK